ncbi:MAG: FAD-dependent oxidoreductase [Anaerolineales bacterium]|nr:FAD-dependent oxidoreductase [Anaerolineales bacterium]
MGTNHKGTRPLRVAIIGAGPAGFYTAGQLLNQEEFPLEVDLFDRLPTPYGLVRGGVAPDHQKIKTVTRIYEKIAKKEGFRFFGNIEFGTDIHLADLRAYYHQVVFATGAQTGRLLNIPGSDLPGSHPASDFVAWYNGHPDYRHFNFDLSQEKVAVIGMGNVALDVARILCRTPEELAKTDIADYALEALRESRVKEVYLLGRRGPAQAAYTPSEIKEIGQLADVDIIVRPEEAQLDAFSQIDLDEHQDKVALKNIETIKAYARLSPAGKGRRLHFRFLISPQVLIGEGSGRVQRMRCVRNRLYQTELGRLQSQPTGQVEEIAVGLVFHSIGYRGVPLPGVPFNLRQWVIEHQKGRVYDPYQATTLPGLYTAGWIKRGASGVIGSNKKDAIETVEVMLEDLAAGRFLHPPKPDRSQVEAMLGQRQPRFVVFKDWLHLDQIEVARGAAHNRPRDKFSVVEEMLTEMEI